MTKLALPPTSCWPQLHKALALLLTEVVSTGEVPSIFRTGLVHPILKKGKNPRRPDSYRRITVTSILGKILEKILMIPLKSTLSPTQSSQQRGFSDASSSNCAALVISEAMLEATNKKCPLYITYLDASKAFDVTSHPSVFTKLFNRGVEGNPGVS